MKQVNEEVQILTKEWELIKHLNKINVGIVLGVRAICAVGFIVIVNMI